MPISFDWSQTIATIPAPSIPAEWLATQGADVNVAFIDTGVNLSLDSLKHLDKAGRKFFTGASTFSVAKLTGQDQVNEADGPGPGHGTQYASLLAGKTPADMSKDVVTGIANAANYFIIKARNPSDQKTTIRNLLNAIELSSNLGIDIVITAQSISASEMKFERITPEELDRVFGLPKVQQMLIFAPLKNREDGESWTEITKNNFPNLRPEVINIAKLPGASDTFTATLDDIKSMPIHYLLSGFEGQLLAKNGEATEMTFSNSGAVTIMGGIAALAVSFFKKQNGGAVPDKVQLDQLLSQCCHALDDAAGSFDKPAFFKKS